MSRLSGLSALGQVSGTVPFMAPEQITNFREARPPVDQYAAAATLYNLLTGKYVHDYPADFQKRLLMVLQDDPVPLRARRPELPEALAAVVHRALAREPENRFAAVAAFRAALLAVPL
jgi:serine/threonine-protein kinase